MGQKEGCPPVSCDAHPTRTHRGGHTRLPAFPYPLPAIPVTTNPRVGGYIPSRVRVREGSAVPAGVPVLLPTHTHPLHSQHGHDSTPVTQAQTWPLPLSSLPYPPTHSHSPSFTLIMTLN